MKKKDLWVFFVVFDGMVDGCEGCEDLGGSEEFERRDSKSQERDLF